MADLTIAPGDRPILHRLAGEGIRANLREALRLTSGCRVEVIMKDNHTLNHDPRRVIRWVQIAHEEAENL